MLTRLGALPRRLRWALRRWSVSADRDFHDTLFSGQAYQPFSFGYPGYATIRRFAELAERHLGGVGHAVDLGCGPGEITCELARRNPGVTFLGIDHSAAAIARANAHAAALRLTNVEFRAADIADFAGDADAVLMFDSFHHLLHPQAFVDALRPRIRRFVLIEPAGDWLGGWQKTLDLDWIAPAIPIDPREMPLGAGGSYAVEFVECRAPATAAPGSEFPASLVLRNAGWRIWRSDDATNPVFASYHWLRRDGTMAIEDGRRTPLPRPLAPGEVLAMTCMVDAPRAPGRYELALDLVEEGVSWFSRAGAPMARTHVRVR